MKTPLCSLVAKLLMMLTLTPCFNANAQNQQLDSIWEISEQRCTLFKNAIRYTEISSKHKLEAYRELLGAYASFSPDSVIAYASNAIDLARRLNENQLELDFLFHLGAAHCFKNNHQEGIEVFDKAGNLALKYGNIHAQASAFSMTAFAYALQGKYHTAIDFYLKALHIFETKNMTEGKITAFTNLAEIYRKLNNYWLAIQYLNKASNLCSENKTLPRERYQWRIVQIYNEYAFNYLEQKKADSALIFALMADSINQGSGVINKCYTKKLLTDIYLTQHKTELAMNAAQEAYRQADILKDKHLYVMAKKALSDVYLMMKKYPEAEAEALEAWTIDSSDVNESRMVAANIARANILMNRHNRAAVFMKKYARLNEQYSENSFQTVISDMTIQYETNKKEQSIEALEGRKELYLVIGLLAVFFAISIWIILHQKIKSEQKEQQIMAANAICEWEKNERKRFAGELHDGINGMLSAMKIELNTSQNLQDIVNKLDICIDTIRRMARRMIPVSLEKLGIKAALNDYCCSFPNVSFNFMGDDRRIDHTIEFNLYCCACELINNAVKHSAAENIDLQLVQNKQQIELIVSDDGVGFDTSTIIFGSGLKNIHNRVTACKGQIEIISSPGNGVETIIQFKLS
ncbi:MAG: tetratricopeptide repeat protein [Prevotellaceae bacterium]|jgi:signal transduction histidine kinase|nr:tetratricopeptide repeat protein [Prevotellaceae bacterium]